MTSEDGKVVAFPSSSPWDPYAARIDAAESPEEAMDVAMQCVHEYAATLDEPARGACLLEVAGELNRIIDAARRETL